MVATSQFPVQQAAIADAAGNAAVVFYPRGGTDWVITHTGIRQITSVTNAAVPQELVYVNGIFREGSDSGALDASDTRFVLNQGDEYSVVWTGAEPGATLVATLNVVQYPAGEAPLE